MLTALKTTLLDMIYPPRCLACGDGTASARGLCGPCWRDTHFIAGPACARCGAPLTGEAAGLIAPGQDGADVCEPCHRRPPAWDAGAAATVYGGPARRCVLAFKHGDRLDMIRPLADWMYPPGRPLIERCDVIAPVPLHWRRLLTRRYNQSAELAPALGRRAGKPAVLDLVTRSRFTTPQERMDWETRARNQAGAFTVTPRRAALVPGRAILLIDDVLTSGATLSACATALKAAGAARVDILVLARVAPGENRGPSADAPPPKAALP